MPNMGMSRGVEAKAYLGYGRQGTCHERHWQGAFGSFGYQHFRIDTFLLILTYVYISVYYKIYVHETKSKRDKHNFKYFKGGAI
jgi:hypothetical protein